MSPSQLRMKVADTYPWIQASHLCWISTTGIKSHDSTRPKSSVLSIFKVRSWFTGNFYVLKSNIPMADQGILNKSFFLLISWPSKEKSVVSVAVLYSKAVLRVNDSIRLLELTVFTAPRARRAESRPVGTSLLAALGVLPPRKMKQLRGNLTTHTTVQTHQWQPVTVTLNSNTAGR